MLQKQLKPKMLQRTIAYEYEDGVIVAVHHVKYKMYDSHDKCQKMQELVRILRQLDSSTELYGWYTSNSAYTK